MVDLSIVMLNYQRVNDPYVKLLAGCVSEGNVVSVWKKRFAIREQNIKCLLGIGYVFLWKNASSRILFK